MAPALQLLDPAPALASSYRSSGLWTDQTLGRMMIGNLGRNPSLTINIWSRQRPQSMTFADLARQALRFAAGLRSRGIRAGDRVCVFVPNSIEGAVAFVAVTTLGAILVPVAPYYGLKELHFILKDSGSRLLVTSAQFIGSKLDQLDAMRADLPDLEDIYVMGEPLPAGTRRFDDLLASDPLTELPSIDPAEVCVIGFTSGTTASPKGVIHRHRSICTEVVAHQDLSPKTPGGSLVGGPISHAAGMLLGLFLPPHRDKPIHLIDGWDPALVLEAMRKHGLSSCGGAPFFLNSLTAHPDVQPADLALIEAVVVGGASVPSAFVERMEQLGIRVCRAYGSTEHPTSALTFPTDALEKRMHSDGRPAPGCEIRIVDEHDADVPQGQEGEILTRGPDMCAGYTDAALTAESFTRDGWFRSGDIGILDRDGYLSVTDRRKDIIVRNGIKVSAVEVEDTLMRLPDVLEVALVAAPDERTGEHGHAFLRLRPNAQQPSLAEVQSHLQAAGLAKQKWPEAVEVVAEFPRTPSGKVKKVELRDRLRNREK